MDVDKNLDKNQERNFLIRFWIKKGAKGWVNYYPFLRALLKSSLCSCHNWDRIGSPSNTLEWNLLTDPYDSQASPLPLNMVWEKLLWSEVKKALCPEGNILYKVIGSLFLMTLLMGRRRRRKRRQHSFWHFSCYIKVLKWSNAEVGISSLRSRSVIRSIGLKIMVNAMGWLLPCLWNLDFGS